MRDIYAFDERNYFADLYGIKIKALQQADNLQILIFTFNSYHGKEENILLLFLNYLENNQMGQKLRIKCIQKKRLLLF